MKIDGQLYRTIWIDKHERLLVINQLKLPHIFEIETLDDIDSVCQAISAMVVRGAGLIGATAAFGMWIASNQAPKDPWHPSLTILKWRHPN